jgi:hypothetical protein
MFDAAKQAVMEISDFEAPQIPFDEILQCFVTRQLAIARDAAIENLERCAREDIASLTPEQLRESASHARSAAQAKARQLKFLEKADERYHLLAGLFPKITKSMLDAIDQAVNREYNEAFLDVCVQKLLPEYRKSILKDIKSQIDKQMAGLQPQDVGTFNFAQISSLLQNRAASQMRDQLISINPAVLLTPEFSECYEKLQLMVARLIEDWENRKFADFERYQTQRDRELERALAARLSEEREKGEARLHEIEEKHMQTIRQMQEASRREKLTAALHAQRLEEEYRAKEQRAEAENLAREKAEEQLRLIQEHTENLKRDYQRIMDERAENHERRVAALTAELQRLRGFPPDWQERRRKSCLLL